MTRYQLAKLVEWAGILRSRKRMQKITFLLQAAGCPFGADFILHRYGVYSQEVARQSDEMVQSNLLEEESEPNQVGQEFYYKLTDRAKQQIVDLEKTPKGRKMSQELAAFKETAEGLLKEDLWEIEVASTIVYFRQQGYEWQEAVERTCKFKNLNPSTQKKFLTRVDELARRFVA